jgi:alkanesulfonate monooxygenase SsuD/methylene tetrahydromethanopterin reductase-like flavin-dependent oxidoreductase (luciferase family)
VWGIDAWVSLTAAAMQTERIRLGTMLSPVSRMRPWKLASESATLDNLSNGRVILAVGLGALDSGFSAFGEITDRKMRAELLDEGLELLTGLWRGMPLRYHGKHYHLEVSEETLFTPAPPPPVQQPRIPIWVVGAWPSKRSMQRALRYDGLLPNVIDANGTVRMSPATPEEIRQMKAYIDANRSEATSFDIVVEGETPGDEPVLALDIVRPYAEAGATWWIEALWTQPDQEKVLQRLQQGPPKPE